MTSAVSSPGMSAVTGKVLSARTVAAYGSDWALFTDWCTATGHTPLPAEWATITAFTAGCPAAPATIRRRLTAIDHHHRAAGYPPPTEPGDRPDPVRPRAPINPGQVELAMRMLPSHGWVGGLFGRRDRALLTLASMTAVPYRQIARMTLGQIRVVDGTATVTHSRGATSIAADPDPVMCGPCSLARWQRIIDVDVRPDRHADLPDLLGRAKPVTPTSTHQCGDPEPLHPQSAEAPLFPPINQWGHFPYPIAPMTRHAAAALSQQAETGLTGHKNLRKVDDLADDADAVEPSTRPSRSWDWEAANQRKIDAVRHLAPLADVLDDIEARIDQLVARTKDLELG